MNENYPPPCGTPLRFQNTADPFFRPINPARFAETRQKDMQPPPPPPSASPTRFRRSQRRKANQPTTISENHVYPNNVQQQQPRVHRTKSESRNLHHNQQRSRSSTNQFQFFSPIQPPPVVQRHFIAFRSPPVFLTSVRSVAPMFYPTQRRQFDSMQPQFRLINHFRLGTNRF